MSLEFQKNRPFVRFFRGDILVTILYLGFITLGLISSPNLLKNNVQVEACSLEPYPIYLRDSPRLPNFRGLVLEPRPLSTWNPLTIGSSFPPQPLHSISRRVGLQAADLFIFFCPQSSSSLTASPPPSPPPLFLHDFQCGCTSCTCAPFRAPRTFNPRHRCRWS